MKYQIQIKTHNYDRGSSTITKDITSEDLENFKELIKTINLNSNKNTWNWFNSIPDKWDGNTYVPDIWKICSHMKENFEYIVTDIDHIIEFFNRFTPNGCDRIDNIKIFKVEEIKI